MMYHLITSVTESYIMVIILDTQLTTINDLKKKVMVFKRNIVSTVQ
jgi:hypothetical protein